MEDREVLQQIKGLTISQRERILRVIKEYFSLNSQLESTMPTIYPYCHAHAKFIKRGKLKKVNKQRFSCKECGHKFLTLLEHYLKEEDQILSGTIEFDETYLLESQKGKKTEKRKARHRDEPSSLRGISHEQVCLVITTDRNGHEIFKAVGYASYNRVEHLNTVNSIHSAIKGAIRQYRGISSKYINRYASLFVFFRRYQDMDIQEMSEKVVPLVRTFFHTVRRNSIHKYTLFLPPAI